MQTSRSARERKSSGRGSPDIACLAEVLRYSAARAITEEARIDAHESECSSTVSHM